MRGILLPIAVWFIILATDADAAEQEFSPADLEFFEKRVRPILVERCFECHSTGSSKLRGGLVLDHRDGVLKGGDSGAAAVPAVPDQSLLIEAIRYDSGGMEMPPAGKLPDREIAILTEWVRKGLPYPATSSQASAADAGWEERRAHWAFQPLRTDFVLPAPPAGLAAWSSTGIDRFILDAQRQRGMRPAAPADRRVLLRRLKLDLLGIPPTLEEIQSFEADESPDAYARLVDRLLASPQYGERWGRHWLDLTRYCDIPESWREGKGEPYLYRDWVVSAWNADLSYDQFVRQQFAADLLPGAKPEDNAALGFLGLSPTYWKELKLDHLVIKQVVAEEWEERIEAISGTFLGLTMACARCHDHKFDPVSMRDYYAVAGVLASVRQADRPIIPEEQAAKAREARVRLEKLQKELDALQAKKPVPEDKAPRIDELTNEMAAIREATPELAIPEACGIVDASLQVVPDGPSRTKLEYRDEPQNVALQIRGNAAKPGDMVPRGFPSLFTTQEEHFGQGSGRREFAESLVTEAAPLVARVFVNRVWMHHFGRGLVTTPSNFGLQGDLPSHPELLDDLAARFMANGWSIKWLHREIVLSATYQQGSQSEHAQQDPDNEWLARMPVRRLDVEAWRDSMLAASGELDLRIGGPPADLLDVKNRRRTLYGTVKRRELADLLRLHDFPDPVAHVALRVPTTTPLQQLFVLNSPLMQSRSAALLQRPDLPPAENRTVRLRALVHFAFAREAAEEEVLAMDAFLSAAVEDGTTPDQAWTQLVQTLLGSNELLFTE